MLDSVSRYKERQIVRSIQQPFKSTVPPETKEYLHHEPTLHLTIVMFFYTILAESLAVFSVVLRFQAPAIFHNLRQSWGISEADYLQSFQAPLHALSGPLGFSGATFFVTFDKRYVVKSLDRSFEWKFYYKHLLVPLAGYQLSHPRSHIVHITDALFSFSPRLGRILKTSPSNFLVMVNSKLGDGWEDYDLKPTNYFFPERDFLGGKLASEKTKEQLHDEFHGEIQLDKEVYELLCKQLDEDSKFLCDMEAIDYSLFVIRRKHGKYEDGAAVVVDALGEWEYKFTILDFFVSTKMTRTKAMRFAVRMLGHGDMTITTQAERYRKDWFTMVKGNLRAVKIVPDSTEKLN